MDFFENLIESLKSNAHILFTGALGATFGFLLSKEPMRERLIGFFSGFILCIVFSEPASHFLANDAYPEIFGFILGAIGRSSAEMVLDLVRNRILSTVKNRTNTEDK